MKTVKEGTMTFVRDEEQGVEYASVMVPWNEDTKPIADIMAQEGWEPYIMYTYYAHKPRPMKPLSFIRDVGKTGG